jgi:4-amino-4-deoxy-L-arabinose transferase-like glycosyltransferase
MKIFETLRAEKYFLPALFLAALAARLAYSLRLSPLSISPDSLDWTGIAGQLVSGKGFGDTWRAPGYPVYLSAIFLIFGKSVAAVRVFNALLGSLNCLVIFMAGKKLFGSAVGRIAALMLAFYPYLIAYSGDLLSETLLTLMISLSLLMIIESSENPSTMNLVLTGVVMGLTVLTKATILPFFLLACGWLWWNTKKLKAALIVGALTLLTIAPWTARNYAHFKQFILVSPGSYSLWLASNDEALHLETTGELDSPVGVTFHWSPERANELNKLPLVESEKIYKAEALAWIKANPEKFHFLIRKRLVHFWRLYPMMAYKWQKAAAMLTSGIYIPLCFIGIILSIKDFKKTSLLIALFAVYTFVHLFYTAMVRYRVPIDPFIMIFAAYTVHYVYAKFAKGGLNEKIR